MSLTFVQGDTAPDLLATLTEEDDTSQVIDLTGCTVRFQMRKPDDHKYTVNSVAAVTNAIAGQVRYSWGVNDLAQWGTFLVQWEVTYPGGRIQTTSPEQTISVRRQ